MNMPIASEIYRPGRYTLVSIERSASTVTEFSFGVVETAEYAICKLGYCQTAVVYEFSWVFKKRLFKGAYNSAILGHHNCLNFILFPWLFYLFRAVFNWYCSYSCIHFYLTIETKAVFHWSLNTNSQYIIYTSSNINR